MWHSPCRLVLSLSLTACTFLLPARCAGAVEAVPRGVGQWPAEWGNHRAVVRVDGSPEAVRVHLPWRRPDRDPQKKAIFVVDAATGKPVENVVPVTVGREYGELVFGPVTSPGTYFIYYLPAPPLRTGIRRSAGYATPQPTADERWRTRAGVSDGALAEGRWRKLPAAELVEFQSLSEFDQFTEMEQIATSGETAKLLADLPDEKYLLFVEDRRHPIRMSDDLPWRWIQRGPSDTFEGQAHRGEFYVWQIGLFAARAAIDDVKATWGELQPVAGTGPSIPASAIRCFNLGGIDWQGRRFTQKVSVEKGKVQALWFGAAVPRDLPPGRYEGTVTLAPDALPARRVWIRLDVDQKALDDGGDSEPGRLARLRWLDSTIAQDDEPVAPYTPLRVRGNVIACLGREVALGATGLPESIRSYFAPEVTHLVDQPREMLAAPVRFVVEQADGTSVAFSGGPPQFTKQNDGVATWRSTATAGPLVLGCDGRMEFDGFVEYRLQLKADEPTEVNDLWLEIPLRPDVARYMMGLGRPGGRRPARHEWKWDRKKHQDCVWVGDVNAGLQCRLFGENYARPLVASYYANRPLNMPPAWYNDGRGSVTIDQPGEDCVVLQARSGPRTLRPGETLRFYFHLLLTPFHPLDTDGHWTRRYHHQYRRPTDTDEIPAIVEGGANILVIHQGNPPLNPFINYPFLTVDALGRFIECAHDNNLRVKLYYTVRELTTRAPELWALRSLGGEVLADGEEGGAAWLREHLVHDYHATWYDAPVNDSSILTTGMSRWHNFYLEGLDWLVKNLKIDGLYLDDLAYDRTVMKRARKILDRNRPGSLIDLHSWNEFCPIAGYACCANLYMEHFPYIDRLFFGESRDYNTPPDYWLVEISGIPFGLMGDMLAGHGKWRSNPWRGMVYGMTDRWGWTGGDPRPLWKLWDDFGMNGSRMIGYWAPDCPVTTDNESVLATVYRRPEKALIALASWTSKKVNCRLQIDWSALGLDASGTQLRAPAVEGFQPETVYRPDEAIPVEPGRGWLLILERRAK